jgi:hypothetical protein
VRVQPLDIGKGIGYYAYGFNVKGMVLNPNTNGLFFLNISIIFSNCCHIPKQASNLVHRRNKKIIKIYNLYHTVFRKDKRKRTLNSSTISSQSSNVRNRWMRTAISQTEQFILPLCLKNAW